MGRTTVIDAKDLRAVRMGPLLVTTGSGPRRMRTVLEADARLETLLVDGCTLPLWHGGLLPPDLPFEEVVGPLESRPVRKL